MQALKDVLHPAVLEEPVQHERQEEGQALQEEQVGHPLVVVVVVDVIPAPVSGQAVAAVDPHARVDPDGGGGGIDDLLRGQGEGAGDVAVRVEGSGSDLKSRLGLLKKFESEQGGGRWGTIFSAICK